MNYLAPAWRHALTVSGLVVALFYYWFAVADRYNIFLYNHLGATPFDERTRSRYWMTGLVAAGAVLAGYTIVHWFLGRWAGVCYRQYQPPVWWRVWLCCILPTASGILLITMTQNRPTLPLSLALACVTATLAGLALALWPGQLAAQRPGELGWLLLFGLGLTPALLSLRVVELPARGLSSPAHAYLAVGGSNLVGLLWLVGLTWLRVRLGKPPMRAGALLAVGLALSYLWAPLAHYLLLTPPAYRYITAATNVFAFDWRVQVLVVVVAALWALGVECGHGGLKARIQITRIVTE